MISSSQNAAQRQTSQGDPSRNKGSGRHHFSPQSPRINNGHPQKAAWCWNSLPNLLAPSPAPPCFSRSALPRQTCLSSGSMGPSPRRLMQTLPTPPLLTHLFYRTSVPMVGGQVSIFRQTTEHLAAHNRQRETLQTAGLKEKKRQELNSRAYMTHIGDTP